MPAFGGTLSPEEIQQVVDVHPDALTERRVPRKAGSKWLSLIVIIVVVALIVVDRAQVVPLDRRDRGRARRRSGSRSASSPRTTRSGSAAKPGYQATLLMPGLRFKLWPMFGVKKFPWVQVPAGEIGVVIAQVGEPLPIGAKSAVYKTGVRRTSRRSREFVERRRAEGRAAAGPPAGHARADPPGRVPRGHDAGRVRAAGVARAGLAVEGRDARRPSRSASHPISSASS